MTKRIQSGTTIFYLMFLLILSVTNACTDDYDLLDPQLTDQWTTIMAGSDLAGNNVRDIMLDSQNRLWVATYGTGVSMYDWAGWTTYNISNSNILNNYITCIEEDADGDIWFGTYDGISILVDNSQWYYLQESYQLYIHDIKKMSNGWIWIGTEDQNYIVFDGSDFYPAPLETTAEWNNVNAIESDKFGNIWLGTDSGAFKWDGIAWNWLNTDDGLPEMEISSLFTDSKGRMWVGTAGGATAAYYDENGFNNISLFNGQYEIYTRSISEDADGNIWFGTWYDGAIKYDGVLMETLKEFNSIVDDDIEAICSDNKGNLWFGTYDQGVIKYTPSVNY